MAATAACGAASPSASQNARLQVVASFSILGDLAHRVGGENIDLKVLVGPGLDTHTFEALPSDSVALAEADLILGIGLGFEPWLSELVQAAEVKVRWIKLGETLPEERLLRINTDESESEPSHEEEHGEFDPHMWQDPALTGELVTVIAAAFSEADPGRSADYHARAEAYTAELLALDAWIVEQLATVPSQQRRLATSHDALDYFAARYGFTIIGSALGHSTETASPSAQDLARLVEDLRANPVPALFGAFGESNVVLNQIAEEAGIPQVLPLYADSLGATGSEGATYLDMMRYNVGVIAAALSP